MNHPTSTAPDDGRVVTARTSPGPRQPAGRGARIAARDQERLVVAAGDVDIATYVFAADLPAWEAPKPFLHPVRTLSGALVTAYRPHDHRWHKGFQMTASHLSGQNLWGGWSWTGDGYHTLDNIGSMRHTGFSEVSEDDDAVTVREDLTWRPADGSRWAQEERTLRFGDVDPEAGTWVLDIATCIRNVRDRPLEFGSPTTHGRPDAGYTGFFWRGPRGWSGGDITTAQVEGPDAMGSTSPWLAYRGRHDEVDGEGTLLFFAGHSSAPHPTRWFVRNEAFPAVAPSFAFHDEVVLEPGEDLRLQHRVVVADRGLDRDGVEELAARWRI